MDYHGIEPFGEFREELRHGNKMALIANINRDSKARPEPFKAVDFMNFHNPPEEKERIYTVEELEEYAKKVFGV